MERGDMMARKTTNMNTTSTAGRAYMAGTYTEGNTVRVRNTYAAPERSYEIPEYENERSRELTRREDREAQRRNMQIRKNRDKALQMNPGFVLFTALAAICILFISINYLRVQNSIVSTMNTIETKELELEQLKANNDLLERKIQIYTDLDYIYEVAMTELGMVRPSEDQILYYESTESEYVRQYDSIP